MVFSYRFAGLFPSVTKIKTGINPDFDFNLLDLATLAAKNRRTYKRRQPRVTPGGAAPKNLSRALSREFLGADQVAGPVRASYVKILEGFLTTGAGGDKEY